MKTLYKIFRTIILLAIGLALVVPPVLFVALELDCVQTPVRKLAEKEVSRLLDAKVEIGSVSIAPFNRLTLRDVTLTVADNDTVARLRRLGAGIDLYALAARRDLIIGYAEIIGLDARLKRDSAGAPLNIQPIIDAVAPKRKDNKPKLFDLRVNTVVIRRSSLTYDVGRDTASAFSRFNPNHIAVSDLRADIRLPRISNNETIIDLNRLALVERSGFALSGISAKALISDSAALIVDPCLKLPNTEICLSSFSVPIKGDFNERLALQPINAAILPGSFVTPADFRAFYPPLASLSEAISIEADAEGSPDNMRLTRLQLEAADNSLELSISDASARNLPRGLQEATAHVGHFELSASADMIKRLMALAPNASIKPSVSNLIGNLSTVAVFGKASLDNSTVEAAGAVTTSPGTIDYEAVLTLRKGATGLKASARTADLDLSALLAGVTPAAASVGSTSFDAMADMTFTRKKPTGSAGATIGHIDYKGRRFSDILADATIDSEGCLKWDLDIGDPDLEAQAEGMTWTGSGKSTATVHVADADLAVFGKIFKNRRLTLDVDAAASSFDPNTLDGYLVVDRLELADSAGHGVHLAGASLRINGSDTPKRIDFNSQAADLAVRGYYDFKTLPRELTEAVSRVFPALVAPKPQVAGARTAAAAPRHNDFEFTLNIKDTSPLEEVVKLPATVVSGVPASISGRVATAWPFVAIEADFPLLKQGKKLIEESHLSAAIDGTGPDSTTRASVALATTFPVKNGNVRLTTDILGVSDALDAAIRWKMDRQRDFSGDVKFSTRFSRPVDESGAALPLAVDVDFSKGTAVFNDTAWTIAPSHIRWSDKHLNVERFRVSRPGQLISIDGEASALPDDSLHLRLTDINLDYVFETLGISNAMFGGRATGNFYASALFSGAPRLYTDDLSVKGIKYNHCLMGDAEVRSSWDIDNKAVIINADITGSHNNVSTIRGFIKPMTEELDMKFHADDVPVGFMLPFMEAFTSAIDGHASGDAHLYGTFKYLDMTGDIFARDFKLKLDFTNCWYATTDSIRMRPGRIDIPGVTLRDHYGNTARLSGLVTHEFFKQPTFKFDITDAKCLLVYDVGPSANAIWYGRVFGDGGARVQGVPGRIDIGVNMSTAPGSSFSFVLSDALEAMDYTFLTFRDRNPAPPDTLRELTPEETIRKLREENARKDTGNDAPSVYAMEFDIDVNPNTLVTLVMDPVGGDRIRARGDGNMRLDYNSADENLKLFGRYTLAEGSYNFTLQDIIIKEFTIDRGSQISFTGDPYSPQLDVKAVYSLNANLSDLDESFLQDKELSRTNVPIQALMNVTGDIRQPNIAFDLRFPTLTDDVYRKVKSIISTEDLMNRQIIYLLALNRFYTPEYMAATRGNELVSVASSTISSQLANILGQLSDNWTIAPNFRSDRGDFSDVEFDVALSSRLLNNRLLLNGNFGYRDKSLNNNSFIGDFDIEYLLNRSGTLRLKAYNRYNDRNFYVKSALTTQGVGLMYRRDFDLLFRFLRPRRPKPEQAAEPENPEKPEKPENPEK